MPFYQPLDVTSTLPRPGEAIEHETLDFKEVYRPQDPKCRYEMAKDMAMFANHLGGTLLVGAVEDATTKRLAHYLPLTEADTAAIQQAFEDALQHCSPRPLVVLARIPHDGGSLLAVNIEPIVGTVIGVRSQNQSDSYRFPLRRASQCAFLSPEVLPMYMLPELRRAVILLERIALHPCIRLIGADGWHFPKQAQSKISLHRISLEDNCVEFVETGQGKPKYRWAPLDAVSTVVIRRENKDAPIDQAKTDVVFKLGHFLRDL